MLAKQKSPTISNSICSLLALSFVFSLGCFILEAGAQVRSGSAVVERSLAEAPQVLPITLTAGSVVVPPAPGVLFTVPFSISSVTGENIFAYYFEITYDSTKMNPSGLNFGCSDGALTSGGPHPTCNVFPGPGSMLISGSGVGTMTGSGVMVNIQFVTAAGIQNGATGPITITPGSVAFFKSTGGQVSNNPPVNGNITFISNAGPATIGGRVLTPAGRAVSSAQVFLTDNGGVSRMVISNPFGYFHFDNVSSGGYLLGATSKKYTFSPRTVSVNGNLAGVDLIAQP